MPPQSVGAVLIFQQNAYEFAAALLQPPKYDSTASDAATYGAIGAIIGHDMSHFVDVLGADYQPDGAMRHWWTAEDSTRFDAAADPIVRQFSAYQPLPGLAVDGRLTRTENVADLAGLTAAFEAYRKALGARAKDRDYVRREDREFFIAFAQAFAAKLNEAALRAQLATGPRAGDVPDGCRAQPGRLVRRIRRGSGRAAVPGARRPRAHLVAAPMRVTVCELPHETRALAVAWLALCEQHTAASGSQLVLMPGIRGGGAGLGVPAVPTPPAGMPSEALGEELLQHLPELGAKYVVGTRAVCRQGRRLNEGYLWSRGVAAGAALAEQVLPAGGGGELGGHLVPAGGPGVSGVPRRAGLVRTQYLHRALGARDVCGLRRAPAPSWCCRLGRRPWPRQRGGCRPGSWRPCGRERFPCLPIASTPPARVEGEDGSSIPTVKCWPSRQLPSRSRPGRSMWRPQSAPRPPTQGMCLRASQKGCTVVASPGGPRRKRVCEDLVSFMNTCLIPSSTRSQRPSS